MTHNWKRHYFPVNTDTGTQGDTGPSFFGAVQQIRWSPSTGDTGGDLRLDLLPRADDTGDGFAFYDNADCLGSAFTQYPRQPTHDPDGNADLHDTGTPIRPVPVVGAGDRIRMKVTPGGSSVVGTLYIWTG